MRGERLLHEGLSNHNQTDEVHEFGMVILRTGTATILNAIGNPATSFGVVSRTNDYGYWKLTDELTRTGKRKQQFVSTLQDFGGSIRYSENPPHKVETKRSFSEGWYLRPARFMFKKYARIWDRVVNVRPEILQDITEEDAIREGIYRVGAPVDPISGFTYKDRWSFNNRKT